VVLGVDDLGVLGLGVEGFEVDGMGMGGLGVGRGVEMTLVMRLGLVPDGPAAD